MKNILFINSNKEWGGGEKWHYQMAIALSARDYNCFFITFPDSELEQKIRNTDFPFLSLAIKNFSFCHPKKRSTLKNYIIKNNITDIFLNLPSDVKLATSIRPSIKNVKLIYRRGMPHPIKKNFLNSLLYPRLDLLIANSNEIKRSITKNLPFLEKRIRVVYNGVESYRGNSKVKSDKIIIGNLGRLVEQKGHHHLIKVAKILNEKNYDFEILIGGKGPLEKTLADEIKAKNLSHRVKLLGHVNPELFYNEIDLFVFPSHFEGSANSLIEAAQYGIPTIAFMTSSMPEMIEDDNTGWLIPPFDEELMSKKIENFILNSDKDSFYKKNSKELIQKKFLFGDKVNQVEGIINEK